jgi:hypothetical protein
MLQQLRHCKRSVTWMHQHSNPRLGSSTNQSAVLAAALRKNGTYDVVIVGAGEYRLVGIDAL